MSEQVDTNLPEADQDDTEEEEVEDEEEDDVEESNFTTASGIGVEADLYEEEYSVDYGNDQDEEEEEDTFWGNFDPVDGEDMDQQLDVRTPSSLSIPSGSSVGSQTISAGKMQNTTFTNPLYFDTQHISTTPGEDEFPYQDDFVWPGEGEWVISDAGSLEDFVRDDEDDMREVEDTETIEEWDYEEIPNRLTSEQEFAQTVMTIAETPAEEKMDRNEDVLDPKVNYWDSATPTPSTPLISKFGPRMFQCPSVESFFKVKNMVDVNFYYTPDSKIYSRDCRLDITILQLKNEISKFVRVPPEHLDFRRNRNLVADKKTMKDLGGRARKKMKFTVEINRRIEGNYDLWIPKRHAVITKPDVLRKLKIETDKGTQWINLRICYDLQKNKYLGGYYNKTSNVKYLHVSTNTMFVNLAKKETDMDVACQTFGDKTTPQQTLQDKYQQMNRRDYYVSNSNDRVLYGRPYLSYDFWEKKRGKAAIVIQRYWRRWLAMKERKRRLDGLIARIEWAENIRKGRTDQRLAIMDDEITRQQHPSRLVDIELLYRAINAWRKEEEEFVKANRWGAERKAALAVLTEMEADLLLDLEKTKTRIRVTHRDDFVERIFLKMGQPKRWLGSKTQIFINMDTYDKLRVRQLHSLHKELKQPVEQKENRLQILDKLYNEIKHFKSRLCNYLIQLIGREISMMNRKASKTLLAGVRQRIANGLFHLCQDPKFNPEAKMLQKVPWDNKKLRKDMVQCKGCRRMQYRDEFTILRGTTMTSRCHTCMGLYRTAILRVDLNLYRHMLKELRRDELQSGVTNSVAFLIEPFDLQFIVEQIWHGQSALSGIDNRYLLRLCRWTKAMPWTPWNSVLLTEEEAVAHLQLDDLRDAYRETFFHKVLITQCAARTYFERLAKLSLGLDERTKEACQELARQAKIKRNRKILLKTKMFSKFGGFAAKQD